MLGITILFGLIAPPLASLSINALRFLGHRQAPVFESRLQVRFMVPLVTLIEIYITRSPAIWPVAHLARHFYCITLLLNVTHFPQFSFLDF
jgi:hypothetical protein